MMCATCVNQRTDRPACDAGVVVIFGPGYKGPTGRAETFGCNLHAPAQLAPETCICAAVRLADGYIVRGHRHNDCMRTARDRADANGSVYTRPAQGFLTTRGRFVDRVEGLRLQLAAGIQSADPARGGEYQTQLYSEDLY